MNKDSKPAIYVVGHRGAAAVCPENTLQGFRYAIDLGVDYVECDVHLTFDNCLVVMHDANVDRTTNGIGAIRGMTFDTVRALDAGEGEQVPTLDEVLEITRDKVHLLCELKGEDTEQATVETVLAHQMAAQVTFTSFHTERIKRVKKMDDGFQIGAIFRNPQEDDIQLAVDLGASGIGANYKLLCFQMVEQARDAGLDIRAWNPDTLPEQQAMIALGVNGVSTNRPDILMGYLQNEK